MNVSPGDLIGPLYVLGVLPKKKRTKGSGYHQDNFEITPEILAAKKVSLTYSPKDPEKVALIPYEGIEQWPGVDFVVENDELRWDSLALELLFEVGDKFVVRYFPINT